MAPPQPSPKREGVKKKSKSAARTTTLAAGLRLMILFINSSRTYLSGTFLTFKCEDISVEVATSSFKFVQVHHFPTYRTFDVQTKRMRPSHRHLVWQYNRCLNFHNFYSSRFIISGLSWMLPTTVAHSCVGALQGNSLSRSPFHRKANTPRTKRTSSKSFSSPAFRMSPA